MDHYNEVNKKDVIKYHIVVITGSDTWIYSVNGTEVKQVDKISILREKSHKKGGQSSARFQANRECQMRDYGNLISSRVSTYAVKGESIFVVSNSGLGKQTLSRIAGDTSSLYFIDMDLSNWSLAAVMNVIKPLISTMNTSNIMTQKIIDEFRSHPDEWIVGREEITHYISEYPWAIKEIYVHASMHDYIVPMTCTVLDGNDENTEIFVSGYGGMMAHVHRIDFN